MTQVKFGLRPYQQSFNNFIDDFFADGHVFHKRNGQQAAKGFAPVNIVEKEKSYQLELVAPGFDKADFKINVNQDVLTVSAEKKSETKSEDQKMIRREYVQHSFSRSFTLDEKIQADAIDAKYENGVLILNLPRKEEVKASVKEISIQ